MGPLALGYHLVAKLGTGAIEDTPGQTVTSDATWWPNLQILMVAKSLSYTSYTSEREHHRKMKHPEASYDLSPLSSHVSSDVLVLQWMRLRESRQF